MKTAARINPRPKTEEGQRIVLHGLNWQTYEKFLDAVGDRAIRLTYDRGNMEISVPRFDHELWKSLLRTLVEMIGVELDIDYICAGSTTLRRQEVDRGLEPDECFYIDNYKAVLGIRDLDLNRLPPPDLAIEVDITSSSVDRMGIYAALGVPEVWRHDGEDLFFYGLREGNYETITTSRQLPVLTVQLVHEFVAGCPEDSDAVIKHYAHQWVKERLLPLWEARQKSPAAKERQPRRKRPPAK